MDASRKLFVSSDPNKGVALLVDQDIKSSTVVNDLKRPFRKATKPQLI